MSKQCQGQWYCFNPLFFTCLFGAWETEFIYFTFFEQQTERDDLIQQREEIAKRLESNECLLREKEDEVFINLERVIYLEEQCDKVFGLY